MALGAVGVGAAGTAKKGKSPEVEVWGARMRPWVVRGWAPHPSCHAGRVKERE